MKNSKTKTFIIPIHWSTNIGNAFFALGIKYLLKQAFPGARVVMFGDQAAYLNISPGFNYRKEPKYSLRYFDHLRPDYIVLAGSVLTEQFPQVWGKSLRALYKAGGKIALIGVGHYDYSPKELISCRNFLKEFPPHVFISRDNSTYENLHDVSSYSYDGIDGAYFIPDIFQPVKTDLPPYIVFNFDKTPEPKIEISSRCKETLHFNFKGRKWQLHFSKHALAASQISGKGFGFLLGLLGFHGTSQNQVGDLMIVRTDHQVNPIIIRRLFRGPNAFAADIPYSYLNIYAQSELTLTDRIHAALVTMAYDRPAMLFTKSGRARIIERMGGDKVVKEPTCLDMSKMAREKKGMIDFLRSVPF